MAIDETGEHVGEIGVRIDAVQLAALDQRGEDGPVLGALVRAGEQAIFLAESRHPSILPMSGNMPLSIIAGTRCSAVASVSSGPTTVKRAGLSTSRCCPAS